MVDESISLAANAGLQPMVGLHALRSPTRERGFFGLRDSAPDLPVQPLLICAADNPHFRRVARALVGQRYAQRGYLTNACANDGEQHLLTLSAMADQHTVGTLGIRFDSRSGLNADSVFSAEVEALRVRGLELCEFTQLALDVDVPSKKVLAALFHTAYIHAHFLQGAQMLVIEVNPRHVAYYRRMLGFKVCSEARLNTRVQAPAVLLSLDFSFVESQVQRFGGQPAMASVARTLYPFFFSPSEESQMVADLRRM
jgi:hypothetical protein